MKQFFITLFMLVGGMSLEAITTQNINEINRDFYDNSGNYFDIIAFDPVLPNLLQKYGKGSKILEIGCGTGMLGVWLKERGYEVTCVEPAQQLAQRAKERGLLVYPQTIQEFETNLQYDCVVAISSLIHVPREELPAQLKKIAACLKPQGVFVTSFIEGEDEGLEDPTQFGRLRYFIKWTEPALHQLMSPHFKLLESHRMYHEKMDRTFMLNVYILKN